MIKAKNIYKTFGAVSVLKGVNLEIQSKEIVAITGPSGTGKTTLLQLLGTLDRPDDTSGDIIISDQNISTLSSKQLASFRNNAIGFVFQFHQLLPEFTSLENVCIPAYIRGDQPSQVISRAKELLDYLGLSERLTHRPATLSGGEQQRVAIARALMNNPEVILADEPSGNLDTASAEHLYELFQQLRDEFSKTFVIVTHSQTLAQKADRVIKMRDGIIEQ